jgi:MtN3 and saliva related transmembrane protein
MKYEYLGFIAGLFTTISLAPQLYRVLRLKSAEEISLSFTICMAFGSLLWLMYGILSSLFSVLLWNAITFIFSSGLVISKIKFGRKKLMTI